MESSSAGQIVCPKCKQLNDADADHCVHCQGHLYIQCRACGEKNLRQARQCSKCGAELHRIKRKRHEHHLQFKSGAWRVVLIVVFVMLLLMALVFFRHYGIKRPL